ncbi:unnamed protein product [Ixodes pacificus]
MTGSPTRDNNGHNPFCRFPSNLVEELVETVIQLSPKARDKLTPDVCAEDLHVLLCSGRLRHFSLWDVEMHSRDFSSALKQMANHSGLLREIEIDGVYVRGKRPETILRSFENIGRLLRSAPQLQVLKLGLSSRSLVDLLQLSDLEELSLTYDCHVELDEVVTLWERTGGVLLPRLRSFYYGDYFSSASSRTVAHLLQHCPLLVDLRADAAGALLAIHEKQFHRDGRLDTRYRLQKTVLGSYIYGTKEDAAGPSPLCVQIATTTCPQLVDLDIYVDSHDSILSLTEFSHLQYLKIMWVNSKVAGCFETSTLSLLHEVGCQLLELCLHSFVKVDLNAVTSLCPSLEAFGLIQCRTVANHGPVSEPFSKLSKLRFIPPAEYPDIQAEDDLVCLLCSCYDLTSFVADVVTDNFLFLVERLLSVNSFPRLQLVGMYCQQPTPSLRDGLLTFLAACSSLKYIVVADSDISELALQANPSLIVRYEYLYVGL